ncbi:ATP-binding protein [Actinosynnema sp. NPDC023658]|uniref:ATP-binding protein n=1 Tax=Actinosynnema sp. NPDC023658 TaxID=3155465 RepID=UPI0033FAE434
MAGRVESELLAGVARFAGPVRGVSVTLISAFGVLAVPTHALPLGLGLFGLMLVGAVADFGGPRVALGLAVVRVVALCAVQGQVGGAGQWTLNVLTITAITVQWEWPLEVAVPTTALLLAVHLMAVGWDGTVVLRVVIECVLARLAFGLVRRSSRRVDELRATRAALERAEAVAVARRAREREYLALLHDTASATFLMVAVHGHQADPAEVAGYARRDLDLLTGASSVAGDGEAADGPVSEAASGRQGNVEQIRATVNDSPVEVGAALRVVVERSPVDVDARWEGVLVPASVALALVRAVREVLSNVERHAGTGVAELSVRAVGGGVRVVVADAGRGFDVDAVSEHRRGLRGSVVERMAAVGGCARVTSRPGRTVVRLEWPCD